MSAMCTSIALACLSSVAAAQTSVLVVDSSGAPGTDFTDVDAAWAAAQSGDILLVRSYLDFSFGHTFPAKRLTLVAEPGPQAPMIQSPTVGGLNSNDFVLFQGLDVRSDGVLASYSQNDGALWFERCILGGNGGPAVSDCDAVVLTHSTLSAPGLNLAGPTFVAAHSALHVFDCEAYSTNGHFALEARASTVDLFGARLSGLDGVAGTPMLCLGTSAGSGLSLLQGSAAQLLATSLSAGVGYPAEDPCGAGRDGVELRTSLDSTYRSIGGSCATLELSSPVRTDERVLATLRGTPGEDAWLLLSRVPGRGFRTPPLDGSIVLGAHWSAYRLGAIPTGGTLVLSAPAPRLTGGDEASVHFAQVVTRDPQRRRFVASAPSALVVLDARF